MKIRQRAKPITPSDIAEAELAEATRVAEAWYKKIMADIRRDRKTSRVYYTHNDGFFRRRHQLTAAGAQVLMEMLRPHYPSSRYWGDINGLNIVVEP